MNSDMAKPEKFGHLHLVYHFTVPLRIKNFDVLKSGCRDVMVLISFTFLVENREQIITEQ